MLLEAWEKGTIGRESSDLPSPTDGSCSPSPGLRQDFSEHTPVFSQIYSPVQKETRPTERGKQAADSTAITESQRDGHLPGAVSTTASTGSPRESHLPSANGITTLIGSPKESHMPSAGGFTTPVGSPRESHGPSEIGTNTPIGSPGESHGPSAVGITTVTSSQKQWHIPNAGSITVFRSEREILMLKSGSTVEFRSGREVIVPNVESTSVSEFARGSSTSVAGSPSESCRQCAGGSLRALGEAGGSSAAGLQGESRMTQAGSAGVSESKGDGGMLGAFSTSINAPQRQNSPFAVSGSETDGSLPGPGGAASTGSEMESGVPSTEGAVLAAPGTKSTSNAAGAPGNSAQGDGGNPEPLAGVQLLASQAEVRGEGDEPAWSSEGSAQEPNVSSEETKASPETLSHTQPTGSPQETAEEDPDLSVDMELLVDTLRSMEPSEIRKPPKISRPSRSSSRGKYVTLPPIDEHHIAPKSQVPLPEALSKLFGRTEQKHLEENGPKQENVDPEEEEEIENPYLSKVDKPQAKEEPRKVYPWENMSTEIEEKTLSLLGKLRQPPGDEKASRNQSILFNANILKGASLLTDLREQKAIPTEDKPYSRLDSSLLYRRYISSVTPPLKALEKEREGRSSPTPIDLALLNAREQSWMPPNGPQLKPCEQLTSEPSPAGVQVSLSPQKAPGIDKSTGQIPLLFMEAEQKNTPPPLLGHPAAGVSKSTLRSQEEAKNPPMKLNGRPGKIILFSESGFAGQKREIWGDVADATPWELSHTVSIRVVRGGWVMYEKPRFHGRKCVLAEGDVEINNPWTAYRKDGEVPENAPFRIGSFKRVVRDYRIPEISLFTEENGEGTKVRFTDSSEDTRVCGKPLKASSIIVHSGLWLIYSRPFFDDDPYVLEPGGYPNLKAWGAKDPSVCSMHPIKLGCPAVEKPGEPKAVIYEKACFQGHSCEVNRDIYALKKQENSQGPVMSTMGSLRILGGCWVGYEKEGFRGHQYLLEEGEYHDWTQWGGYNNELASLRLIRTDFSDPALVLFEAKDFQDGPSVELSEALPDVELASYGITTQSIHVLSGVWVAYENTNFSGEQYILEKGVYRNCEDWGASDGRISSVQPVLQVAEHSLHIVSRIQLFSDPNYLGDHISFEDDQVSLPEAFAPQSCRVHGGSWILYDGWEFKGEQHVLSDGEYPTLTAMGCVSSTVTRSLKKVPIFFSEPSIFLHGLECFEGKEIELTSEVRSLQAEGFNNHVLSVRVKGGIWVLCEHSNFRGRQWLLDCTEITNWLTYSGLQHIGSLYPIRQRRIYFRIKNAELQFFLSVPDDVEDMKAGRVVVSDLSDQSSSIWYYEEGLIKNQVAPTMSLQVIGLAGKGAKVVLWAESRVPRQTWRIDSFGRICSQMFEDMILDVKGAAPTDMELMSSMMQKIGLLEQKAKSQAQEIQLKARKVAELEKQVKILQKGKDSPASSGIEELEVKCLQLQNQVWEMERFLNDYGLIWVGERNEQLEELKSLKRQENQPSRGLWKPGHSTVSNYPIDFDLIFENLKDLNVLAGEGVSQIERTAGGARLRQPQSISLTFYQNGIVMFNGPFRSYEEPSTQQCLQDIMDGYFPSELQTRYPDGVPFQVRHPCNLGPVLSPSSVLGITCAGAIAMEPDQISAAVLTIVNTSGIIQRETSGGPGCLHIPSSVSTDQGKRLGPKLSLEQFLNKLPKSLIREGQVIDIRGPIKETLQGSDGTSSNEVILVETPILGAMKERLKADEQDQPPAPIISTLRIKSENGEQTYIVKMLFTETIGDLRRHLAQSRGGESQLYEIISTFPQRVYADNFMTLQECGLIPNASLLLREKIPSAKEGQGHR
ncbi:Absent in melanoma 1-like protein [Chelonia mydas]|uniref:UBX domain-containing protein 11 n=1 Tax=Chelonia mydas TaxID=8469 RepID=M7BG46_CHEMY|nr:Absent in melanoma 1-like protein [Chelonia mydas]